jgi:GNAT superfamily N-acetyltransferase
MPPNPAGPSCSASIVRLAVTASRLPAIASHAIGSADPRPRPGDHEPGFGACEQTDNNGRLGLVTERIRAAEAADVDAIATMASERRSQYAQYQPVFWRSAANAEQVQRPYLVQLIDDQNVITLVSEESGTITGFLIAMLGDAPPVYDPGGQTCDIDDFVVAPGRWATTGVQLLRSAIEHASERGAVQAVVVTAHLDQDKREALRLCGLSIASEWWVTSWQPKNSDRSVLGS